MYSKRYSEVLRSLRQKYTDKYDSIPFNEYTINVIKVIVEKVDKGVLFQSSNMQRCFFEGLKVLTKIEKQK